MTVVHALLFILNRNSDQNLITRSDGSSYIFTIFGKAQLNYLSLHSIEDPK